MRSRPLAAGPDTEVFTGSPWRNPVEVTLLHCVLSYTLLSFYTS